MRIKAPFNLDKFAASPVGDRNEFAKAFRAIRGVYPSIDLTYIGTDGRYHYFQKWGDPVSYAVPVTSGWKLPRNRTLH
jgi:hypothetical protein